MISLRRQLAVEIGDLLLVRLAGDDFELLGNADRFPPVLLLFVDLQQELERRLGMRRAFQLQEQFLGTVEQTRLEVVLRQFEQCRELFVLGQVGALGQVLVHADRALDLAAAAKQAAQRKMQFDGLRIDLDHLDERLDRLVRLLIEQKVESLEIRCRQRARLRQRAA